MAMAHWPMAHVPCVWGTFVWNIVLLANIQFHLAFQLAHRPIFEALRFETFFFQKHTDFPTCSYSHTHTHTVYSYSNLKWESFVWGILVWNIFPTETYRLPNLLIPYPNLPQMRVLRLRLGLKHLSSRNIPYKFPGFTDCSYPKVPQMKSFVWCEALMFETCSFWILATIPVSQRADTPKRLEQEFFVVLFERFLYRLWKLFVSESVSNESPLCEALLFWNEFFLHTYWLPNLLIPECTSNESPSFVAFCLKFFVLANIPDARIVHIWKCLKWNSFVWGTFVWNNLISANIPACQPAHTIPYQCHTIPCILYTCLWMSPSGVFPLSCVVPWLYGPMAHGCMYKTSFHTGLSFTLGCRSLSCVTISGYAKSGGDSPAFPMLALATMLVQ